MSTVEDVLKEDSNLSAGDITNIAKFINDLNFGKKGTGTFLKR